MDVGNMRLQEGIFLERHAAEIGVIGIGKGAGATFVSYQLDDLLNGKDRQKVFVSRPDRFRITDEPEDPEDEDIVIAVIDPLPSKLMEGADTIGKLTELKAPVLWLVNRDNPGVNRRSMEKYLGFRPEFRQEEVPREMICRAEYNCIRLSNIYKTDGLEKLAEHIRIIFADSSE